MGSLQTREAWIPCTCRARDQGQVLRPPARLPRALPSPAAVLRRERKVLLSAELDPNRLPLTWGDSGWGVSESLADSSGLTDIHLCSSFGWIWTN